MKDKVKLRAYSEFKKTLKDITYENNAWFWPEYFSLKDIIRTFSKTWMEPEDPTVVMYQC